MLKIGVISQKGGVGKSTLARDIARQFAADGWRVKIADLDLKQTTSCDWNRLRMDRSIAPEVAVEAFQSPTKALSITGFHLVVFDGKPHSDIETKRIADVSDLVVIPTGPTRDDLVPQIKLGMELVRAGVESDRLLYVINNTTAPDGSEVRDAQDFVRQAGFRVVEQAIPRRLAYQNAQNQGRSISEVPFPNLSEIARKAVEQIGVRLRELTQ